MKKELGKIDQNIIQSQSGITLIILAVTIVVILILASITVDFAWKDSGIIKTALGLQNVVKDAERNDQEIATNVSHYINEAVTGNGSGGGDIEEPPQEATPTAPTMTVNGKKGENGYYASDVEVIFHKSDKLQTMTYKIDDVTKEIVVQDGDSITITEDGTYKIVAYMYNAEGEVSKPATVNFVKDSVAPIVTIQLTNQDSSEVQVQIIGNDPEPASGLTSYQAYTLYYQLAGTTEWIEAGTTNASTYNYTNLLPDTDYHLQATAKDKAGNIGTSNVIENVQVTTLPTVVSVSQWSDTYLQQGETATFTIELSKPVKQQETTPTLTPNNTGSALALEAVEPDANGYATLWKVTITAGKGNGTETVQIPIGTLADNKGNEVVAIEQMAITIDNMQPTVGTPTNPSGKTEITTGETVIIILPATEDVIIDESKFIPKDEEGNLLDVTVNVSKDEEGNIHIEMTAGTEDGNVVIEIRTRWNHR